MATLTIRVDEGDWGGAQLGDVEAVARSAAASFAALDDDESVAIVLGATEGEDDSPIALSSLSSSGEFVVRLNARGNLWARLAYQFSHEFCHVLADPRTWTVDRFAWIEEALCEAASLFALRAMAKGWAIEPPRPNWRDYASSLANYAAEQMFAPTCCLATGVLFSSWLSDRLPLLEVASFRRDDNTIIAKELLPIMEKDSAAWRAVRYLHSWPRSPEGTLADFMHGWATACPAECRSAVGSMARLLDVRA